MKLCPKTCYNLSVARLSNFNKPTGVGTYYKASKKIVSAIVLLNHGMVPTLHEGVNRISWQVKPVNMHSRGGLKELKIKGKHHLQSDRRHSRNHSLVSKS